MDFEEHPEFRMNPKSNDWSPDKKMRGHRDTGKKAT